VRYEELLAREPLQLPAGTPDRLYDLTLSGTQIERQSYPEADPLPVAEGEWVRFTMRSTSSKWHPMHVHGHHFQVLRGHRARSGEGPRRRPRAGGEVTVDFLAANPGWWLFHCHNHQHVEDGMLRVVEYVRGG
jgi:FtsP/CotA-like multicopper oxidase with cupredoxin domain